MLFQLFSRVTALQSPTHADEEPEIVEQCIAFDAGLSGIIRSSAWKFSHQIGQKIAVDLLSVGVI
ncbi:hypothetical protein BHK98_01870 [Hornefia porci]|uniref:Uncharacterized protein n=1 Tax=Hornefia porci TaxID=2652292 RepID=A0A1Q9JFG2_9FIRM|nr:hypothetical protein BHK98_01870 [Hornefia porci]